MACLVLSCLSLAAVVPPICIQDSRVNEGNIHLESTTVGLNILELAHKHVFITSTRGSRGAYPVSL